MPLKRERTRQGPTTSPYMSGRIPAECVTTEQKYTGGEVTAGIYFAFETLKEISGQPSSYCRLE